MKKFSLLSVLVLFAISFTACEVVNERVEGNGKVESEKRKISRANKIKLLGSMDVEVVPGETSVRVEADENILPYIITEIDHNWLEIKLRKGISIKTANPIKVYITTPSLYNVSVAGSGDVVIDGEFDNGDKADFNIAGSGDITATAFAPKVEVDIAGSGNLRLSGETRDLDVNIAGSGNCDANDLKAENAAVNIAGSGDAFVFADVKLKANIVGSGNVSYKGNATVAKKVMGSGAISKLP